MAHKKKPHMKEKEMKCEGKQMMKKEHGKKETMPKREHKGK